MKRAFFIVILTSYFTSLTVAQGPLTPAPQLRILTDANNAILVANAAQVDPVSAPTPWSQARVRTDNDGNLLVTGMGGSGFDPDEQNDFGAIQFFPFGINFGTIMTPLSYLENDTENSPLTGNTLRLANGTTRQTFRVYGDETADPTTAHFIELSPPDDPGATANIKYQRGDALGNGLLAIRAELAVLLGGITQTQLGVYAETSTVGSKGVQVIAQGQYQWGSVSVGDTSDTGLARDAAGEVRVSNGTSGHGVLDAASYKVNNTAGASATCASGVDAITVSGGIITSITCTP